MALRDDIAYIAIIIIYSPATLQRWSKGEILRLPKALPRGRRKTGQKCNADTEATPASVIQT